MGIHVSLSEGSLKHLEKVKKRNGLSSYSQAINWMCATDSLAVLLRQLLEIKETSGHKIYTADGKTDIKEDVMEFGKCQYPLCKFEGKVTKGEYKEHVNDTDEDFTHLIYLCDKHLKAGINYV